MGENQDKKHSGKKSSEDEDKPALMKKEKEELQTVVEKDDSAVQKPEEIPKTGIKEGEEIDTLKAALLDKEKLLEEYHDKLLRATAELDNFKKRTEKGIQEFKSYANAQLARELLVVIDDFRSALNTENANADTGFMKGLEMIYDNLVSILAKEGLFIINTKDEKFDPWKHEAVEMVPSEEYPEHTIIGVVQEGYVFKHKVLRPAKVKVAIIPKKEDEDNDDNKKKDNEKDDE